MCQTCQPRQAPHGMDRRRFLRFATIGASALLASGSLLGSVAFADTPAAPPKPHNVIDPEQALERLKAGNKRYIKGVMKRHDFLAEREALVKGQNPFVAVLSCADSRITPEYAFDTGRGDVFAVRIAGNFVTTDGLASLEYAVAVLGTPLLVVLGHDSCGAVSAAIKAVKEKAVFPGQIQSLATAISPSVEKVLSAPGDLLENAVVQNVKDTVSKLKADSPVLTDAIASGKLKVVGGVYKLQSGKVEWLV
ncbi:MAG: carbonic anhydrase [Pseudomonas sp.]|nr:carbonic anhydrase [Pseudomonas sp.]